MTLCTFGNRHARVPKDGESIDIQNVGDWKAVLEQHHDFDAHIWPYVRYLDGEVAPPVRVSAKAGQQVTEGDVLCSLVFLDYDDDVNVNHLEVLERFASVDEGILQDYAAIYATRSGLRFVYRLASPVLPGEYGPICRGLALELFRRTGLKVDATTDQWFRSFRLPNVMREDGKAGGPTWEQNYYFEPVVTDTVIDPEDIPHVNADLPWKKGRSAAKSDDQKPDTDHQLPESRVRLYKKALRGSRYREYIFEEYEITLGRRDETLMAMSAETVARCYTRVPESTATEIFYLLSPITLKMEGDGSEPWPDKLWRMVQHCWNGEVDKEEKRNAKHASDRTQRDVVVEEMLKRFPKELIPNDPAERFEFAQAHLVLQAGTSIYPVKPDGSYETRPIQAKQITAYINSNRLHYLSPDAFREENGNLMSSGKILDRNSSVVRGVTYEARSGMDTIIERSGDGICLSISPFQFDPRLLEAAELDADIDGWLDTFPDPAGLRRWLAAALAIDRGPTSALYLMGPARVGKSMLGVGLAECFGHLPVSASQAFDNFNGALMNSPVVLVDEGLPARKGMGMSTPDTFRSLITGSGVSVQEKFHAAVQFNVPFRFVFAANSFNMAEQLVEGRALTREDREALNERIHVMITDSKPADYLDSRGAMAFTREHPKGAWIGGEKRLARHLIRNYQIQFEESDFVRDGRMLVKGANSEDSLDTAFDLSGHGAQIVDLLIEYSEAVLEKKASTKIAQCMRMNVPAGKVYVNLGNFLRALTDGRRGRRDAESNALERFKSGEEYVTAKGNRLVGIDLERLKRAAYAIGHSVQHLEKLIDKSHGVA